MEAVVVREAVTEAVTEAATETDTDGGRVDVLLGPVVFVIVTSDDGEDVALRVGPFSLRAAKRTT